MKKYSAILFYMIISILFAVFMYFYYSQRIIILWHKETDENNKLEYSALLHYQGTWMNPINDHAEIINIRLPQKSIAENTNSEKLINLFLQSYFHQINIAYNQKYSFQFVHAILYNHNIIIQGRINSKSNISILDEYYFLKSIFISLRSVIPSLQMIVIYENDKLLSLEHCIPFFSHHMLIEYTKIKYDNSLEKNKYRPIIIGYLQGALGNVIDNYYEKSIYQNERLKEKCLLVFDTQLKKNNNFINQYRPDLPQQVIYYTQFMQNNNEGMHIFYYPFLSKKNSMSIQSIDIIPELVMESEDIAILYDLKSKFPDAKIFLAPLKLFFNTIYPQFFLCIQVKKFSEIASLMDAIISL